MNEEKRLSIRKICVLMGIALIVAGIVVTVFWLCRVNRAFKMSEYYVTSLNSIIPEPVGAVPESRRDNTMATLSVDGIDFVGILEMPRFESALPVCEDWGSVSKYPCRFDGSVYDRTLKIGLTSQKGQFDFYREISVGDAVSFIDAEGNRFGYRVSDIRYEKSASLDALTAKDSSLTLFVKNMYSREYIVIFCDVLG